MSIIKQIKDSVPRTKKFLQKSLSLWSTHGYDEEYGGYFEALDFEANPLITLDKRFRIHPRTIFSHAAGTVWGYYDGLHTAEKAFDFITKKCWIPSGGFATLSDRTSNIKDNTIKTYDHAFVMLGLGWLYKASNKTIHKTWLKKIWHEVLQSRLLHTDGGFLTSIPHDDGPIRLQNPHMHMLEAMLNLVELFDETIWQDAARLLYQLFVDHFISSDNTKLFEFFNDDWSLDTHKGHSLEPGHHYEWVWILEKYESIMQEPVPMLESLFQFAIKGSNKIGLGYDETDSQANPIRNTHRMWIQTEIIKANIAMYKHSKNDLYIVASYRAFENLFSNYLIEPLGIWYDQLDDNLQNISVNAPTSTLYHVVVALHEYITMAETL